MKADNTCIDYNSVHTSPTKKSKLEYCPINGIQIPNHNYDVIYAGATVIDGVRTEIWKKPAEGFKDPVVITPTAQLYNGIIYNITRSRKYFVFCKDNLEFFLHRTVWVDAFGLIPAGHVIHHKDHNKKNNQLSNLECLSEREHVQRHMVERTALLNEEINCVFCGKSFNPKVVIKTGEIKVACSNSCSLFYYRRKTKDKTAERNRKWREKKSRQSSRKC